MNTLRVLVKCVCSVLLALAAFATDPAQAAMVHRWSFNDGTANDSAGTAHGTLYGTATIVNGRLQLSGSSPANRMEATLGAPLGVNKTLVAWFTLSSLTPDNTAGGPLAVETAELSAWDSITYGERTPGQWMNASENWNRTVGDNGGAPETLVEPGEIMVAITYDASAGNKIKLYRNSVLYAEHNQGTLVSYLANGMAVIGPRVGNANGQAGYMDGYINEARIYDTALTADQIAALSLSITLEFTQEPQNLFAYAGEAHSLVGKAMGGEPIGYQWYKNGAPLNGAISTNLTFPSLQLTNTGSYFLVASNVSQVITTRVAQVVVRTPADGGLLVRWTFDAGTPRDGASGLMDGTLYGTATIVDGRLQLSGSSPANRMEATLGVPLGVNKTLMAWFTLSTLAPDNTAGGPLAVETADLGAFDSITYGERTPGQWMSGSDYWRRTPADNGGAPETLVEPDEIMMAIVYDASAGNKIKLYRNGVLYAEHNQGTLVSYLADGMVLIGRASGTPTDRPATWTATSTRPASTARL